MFKLGDVVQLKSGGPKMTVTSVGKDDKGNDVIWTVWFDSAEKESHGHYPANAVTLF